MIDEADTYRRYVVTGLHSAAWDDQACTVQVTGPLHPSLRSDIPITVVVTKSYTPDQARISAGLGFRLDWFISAPFEPWPGHTTGRGRSTAAGTGPSPSLPGRWGWDRSYVGRHLRLTLLVPYVRLVFRLKKVLLGEPKPSRGVRHGIEH